MTNTRGFTLIELLIVIAIIGILAAMALIMINPAERIRQSNYNRAKTELNQIGKAIDMYAIDYGSYPADVNRNLPNGLERYLTTAPTWPAGPFDGSVYDYDNWEGQTCWNGQRGGVQVTLREIERFRPGNNDWTMYFVLSGRGLPHCSNSATRGECINCADDYN